MAVADLISVLIYAAVVNGLTEFVQYYFVLSTEAHKTSQAAADRVLANLDVLKTSSKIEKKNTQRQITSLEKQLTTIRAANSGLQMRAAFMSALILLIAFTQINSLYGGVAVAKLPFEPISVFRSMARRGLPDDAAPNACSATFIYVLASMVFKQLAAILFPKQVVKGPGIWEQASNMAERLAGAVEK
ncbi:integral membrane protein DUF106-domain-containing protein [Blastocladiella britannica]|nr:integral membrane protein DUF106-domain-containing protein [Blastocladiella britannica]